MSKSINNIKQEIASFLNTINIEPIKMSYVHGKVHDVDNDTIVDDDVMNVTVNTNLNELNEDNNRRMFLFDAYMYQDHGIMLNFDW